MIRIKNTNIYTNENLLEQQNNSTEYKQQKFIKSLLKPLTEANIIFASDPIQEERLSICKSCEFYKNEAGEESCGQCGCPLKTKVSIAEESCPLKKWIAIKTQSSGGCGCGKK